jgi:hypothetical protein
MSGHFYGGCLGGHEAIAHSILRWRKPGGVHSLLHHQSVLIYKPDEPRVGEYIMTAYWCHERDGFVPVGGIHKQGYYSEWAGCDQGYPTHWMPLPAAPADKAPTDWIEWKGGECPVSEDTVVEIHLRCDERNEGPARGFEWSHDIARFGYEGDDDIIAYRVVQS